jgi:hypothetical protein
VKKSLANAADAAEIEMRLRALTAGDRAVWGRMSVEQMVCHVREAFRAAIEGRVLTPGMKMPLPRAAVKFLALRAARPWRQGVKSAVELEPGQPGTAPLEFAADRTGAIEAMNEFRAHPTECGHPYFGKMSANDWLRWGYLHADHHLRQFGR